MYNSLANFCKINKGCFFDRVPIDELQKYLSDKLNGNLSIIPAFNPKYGEVSISFTHNFEGVEVVKNIDINIGKVITKRVDHNTYEDANNAFMNHVGGDFMIERADLSKELRVGWVVSKLSSAEHHTLHLTGLKGRGR